MESIRKNKVQQYKLKLKHQSRMQQAPSHMMRRKLKTRRGTANHPQQQTHHKAKLYDQLRKGPDQEKESKSRDGKQKNTGTKNKPEETISTRKNHPGVHLSQGCNIKKHLNATGIERQPGPSGGNQPSGVPGHTIPLEVRAQLKRETMTHSLSMPQRQPTEANLKEATMLQEHTRSNGHVTARAEMYTEETVLRQRKQPQAGNQKDTTAIDPKGELTTNTSQVKEEDDES